MNKDQLINKIEQAWQEFTASTDGLSEPQMLEPGVVGVWSISDIIAHVSTWEEECLKALPLILSGQRLPRYSDLYGGIDAFNTQMIAKNRLLSINEILKRRDDTHQRLLEYIRKTPDEQIVTETRFRRRIRFDSYAHYPEHTEAILEWRERKS